MDLEDVQAHISLVDSFRSEIRRKRKIALEDNNAYWVHEKPFKEPARIKISLSRPLSDAEKIYFRDNFHKSGFISESGGATASMVNTWQPHSGTYLAHFYNFKIRLSKNEQLYAESNILGSVRLYSAVLKMLDEHFVNIFPQAVKTLRELG